MAGSVETFAERLNYAMKASGMTPGMLAIKTGISERTIRNYQKGKTQPGIYLATLIAEALRVSMDWLTDRD